MTPFFRFTLQQQEVFTRLRFRRQWRTGWGGKRDATANELIEGTRLHDTAGEAKIEVVARCQPEHRVIAHQVLVALTDAHGHHHAIGQ